MKRGRNREYEYFLTPKKEGEGREEGGKAVRISQKKSDVTWARKGRDGQELARSPMVGFLLPGAVARTGGRQSWPGTRSHSIYRAWLIKGHRRHTEAERALDSQMQCACL